MEVPWITPFWIIPRTRALDRRQRRRRVGEPRPLAIVGAPEHYPIGQFYNIDVDMQQPYHIYGGMQTTRRGVVRFRCPTAGHRQRALVSNGVLRRPVNVVDPLDGNIVYTNCQNGRIVRYDRKTGERKSIMPQAEAVQPPLRWNWTAPIIVSPHDSARSTPRRSACSSPRPRQTWTSVSPISATT